MILSNDPVPGCLIEHNHFGERFSYTVNFAVVIALDPEDRRRSYCLELQLGKSGRQNTVARVANVETTGGTIGIDWMPIGTTGDFASSLSMFCQPALQAPQVTGVLGSAVTRVRFEVELSTDCSCTDAMTFWLHDDLGHYLPTSAAGVPGLLAQVSWNTSGQFTAEGFIGFATNNNPGASGFWGRVIAVET